VATAPGSAASITPPDSSPDRNPWDKQPGESSKAFAAFAVYRDLGLERSLTRVARQLNKSIQLISRWSLNHDWRSRVEAFEVHADELTQMQTLRQRVEMNRSILLTAQQLQSKAIAALLALQPVYESTDGKKRSTMKPSEIGKFVELSAKLQYQVLGKAKEDRVTHFEVILGTADEES
jgi:hypothetical protein